MFHFFAYISRMKYINRWSLMRNSFSENIQEHSHSVAVIAHALGVIRRDVLGIACDPNACATAALYHDAAEILTGDLPTPIKYHNPAIRDAYKQVERVAGDKLLGMLPEKLRPTYAPLLNPVDEEVEQLIKAADKLSAWIKCVEEMKAGNLEFRAAAEQTEKALDAYQLPEVAFFKEHFMPSFRLTLDEME